jgi:hypothetical protein
MLGPEFHAIAFDKNNPDVFAMRKQLQKLECIFGTSWIEKEENQFSSLKNKTNSVL